jgi:hypothetical protein
VLTTGARRLARTGPGRGWRGEAGWLAAAALITAVALGLRLWGIRHGLPYIYNVDENANFVPRAIGMFGHSYNPGYFVNPPAFTYLLYAAFELRWSREAVGDAYAVDRGAVFEVARVVAALLGTLAVGVLLWAGRRLSGGAAGLIAGALLAVAFLPVHYSRLALNDVPTLAPVCLTLLGVATIYRHNELRGYALAGAALGVACAFKYTAGIMLVTVVAAALVTPAADGAMSRARGLVVAGALALAGFLVANPFALLDFDAFSEGIRHQSEASGDGGGKLGLTQGSGLVYYLGTTTWGLGWLPAVAAIGGAARLLLRDRRLAAVLIPAPLLFLAFMGVQDRFFARWLLPVYPLLCLLAAIGVVVVAVHAGRRVRGVSSGRVAALLGLLLCAQGVVYSVHNAIALSRPDTRQLARDWMVANVPMRAKVVIEPFLPAAWAADAESVTRGTGNGMRWNKWPTTRTTVQPDGSFGRSRIIRFEEYERVLYPDLIGAYRRGGYCWVVTGSTQYGRAYAEPEEVPRALAYYDELERVGEQVFVTRPDGEGGSRLPFSFDFSFNAYPLGYDRMGPEVRIYRLAGGDRC